MKKILLEFRYRGLHWCIQKRSSMFVIMLMSINLFQAQATEKDHKGEVISLSFENATLREILDDIETKTPYRFFYNARLLDASQRVSIRVEHMAIDAAISTLFKNLPDVTYKIQGHQVVVKRRRNAETGSTRSDRTSDETSSTASESSQSTNHDQLSYKFTVEGTVVSETGEGMPGVNVIVKGTLNGTTTDNNGKYTISVEDNAEALVFSFIGYATQEVMISARTVVDVTMQPDLQSLEEVVVVGYGEVKKSDLTGSVASVSAEAINRFPTGNVTEMLRGQAPGLLVSLADPSPGGASSIRIRGNRSLSSGQEPLFMVDGMIVPTINDLNPTDIKSIEILKDASAQAIYGSRASNGVILITTKRGESGKVVVELSSYVGFQKFWKNFDTYTAQEWVDLRFWAKYNEGNTGVGTPDNINYESVLDDPMMYDAYTNNKFTDWESLMLGSAPQHKHDVSIRGGSERVKYSAGFGYYNQEGVVEKSGFERGTFRLNTDFNVSKWLDLGTNISYTRSKKQNADGSFNQFITRPVLAQPYDANGELTREVTSAGDINPLWRIRNYDNEQRDEYLTLGAFAVVKLYKGLTYRFNGNIRTNDRESANYRTKLYPSSTGEGGISNFVRTSWLIDNIVTYDVPLQNEKHQLKLTLIQNVISDLQKTTGYDFINSTTDKFGWDIAGDSEISGATRAITRTNSISFAGRVEYNLLDRYLFTGSFRRDGASVFGRENKWANFPSAAVAWKISEEPFFPKNKWVESAKARVSYGIVGNWAIPPYRTLGLADSYEYVFGNGLSVGYLPASQLQNLGLKWETTGSLNVGLDLALLGGKLTTTVEHFQTKTKDLLVQRTIPSITGYTSMWDNLGKTKSTGWEVSLDYRVIEKEKFSVRVGGSFSKQKNEIVAIDGRVDAEGKPVNDITNSWFIGKPINVMYDYRFGGIWQEGETPTENDYLPGDAVPVRGNIRIADENGDGKITTDDRKIYSLDPSWYASFNLSVEFYGFDCLLDFYTVQGVQKNNIYMYNFDAGGSLNGKLNGMKVDYWTPTNPSNTAPRPQFTASVPYFNILGIQDASYFRLRTATLGYTIPRALTNRVRLERVRLYATGTNLFTRTDYKSYSPEGTPGLYPEARTYTFGLNLSL